MGKIKATKTEQAEDADEAAIVLLGRDEGGRSHASTFSAVEAELAERAAAIMGMSVLRVVTDEHRAVASELARGKIFSSGKAFTPFVAEGTYKRLEAFGEAFQPQPAAEAIAPTHSSIPADWSSIAVGALVLASEGPSRGFFEAVVVEAPGEGLFVCQWRDWPNIAPFLRRREHIALLTDDIATLTEPLDGAPVTDGGVVEAEA